MNLDTADSPGRYIPPDLLWESFELLKDLSTCSVSTRFHKLRLFSKCETDSIAIISSDGYYHYLYVTRNIVTNKIYVGIHSTMDLDDQYVGSGTHLHNSINKYGIDKFITVKLLYFTSRNLALTSEKLIVSEEFVEYVQSKKIGYNLITGGSGGWGSGSNNAAHKRIKQGTHNFQVDNPMVRWTAEGRNPATILASQGRHHFQNPDWVRQNNQKMIKDEVHNFVNRPDVNRVKNWLDSLKPGSYEVTESTAELLQYSRLQSVATGIERNIERRNLNMKIVKISPSLYTLDVY